MRKKKETKPPEPPAVHAHVIRGENYAQRVVDGDIPACKWVKLACQRHLDDRKRETDPDWRWKWVPKQANDKCEFVEKFPHIKGKWAAENDPFILEPFQCFLMLSIYGWVDKDDPKIYRFRRALIMMPRKNGKSDLAARIGLDKFANDGEFGAEVYSGATSEKQAWEVFGPAHKMASREPDFLSFFGVTVMKSNLSRKDGSKFEPVIAKPGDGASPSCAIIDEYHEHPDDTQLNTMETGMGARQRPLSLIITTAGENLAGPCYALQKDLEKILEGTIENDRFFGIVFSIDEDDDPFTLKALKKANPNFDVSVSSDFLMQQMREAKQSSIKQSIYKIKHCNVWVGAQRAFFNVRGWETSPQAMAMESYKGRRLFVGLDLASTRDIAAVVYLFELDDGRYAVFPKCYIPESAVQSGANPHYQGWSIDGWLMVTKGNMIDYLMIEADIEAIHSRFGIVELAFDPAYAQRTVQGFMANGINCIEVRSTYLNFSAPMKHLDGLIMEGKIEHAPDPCMQWQISNVVAKTDNKDNVYPEKERADAKIDAPVALIMAMNRALIHQASAPDYQIMFVG